MSEKLDEVEKIVNEIYCDLGLDGQEDWDRVSEILYRAFTKPSPVQSDDKGCDCESCRAIEGLNIEGLRCAVKQSPVQSAEEFARSLEWMSINRRPDINQWVNHIQARDAAQREKGRQEREGELEAMHEAWCDDIKERYAALVEAVRRRVDPTTRCDECLLTELTKALRDLDEAKGGK